MVKIAQYWLCNVFNVNVKVEAIKNSLSFVSRIEVQSLWQRRKQHNNQIRTMIGLFLRSVNELPTMMLRRVANVRYISQTNRILEKSSSSTSTPPPQQPPSTESSSSSTSSAQPWQKPASAGYKLTNFDKRILVWSGKYKNVNETPSIVA